MKIGILTYHYVCNYGANLQALSTVFYLRNRGHTPVIIDWRPADTEDRYHRQTPPAQIAAHRELAAMYFPVSALCRTSRDIAAVIQKEGIQGVIVGSDAVVNIIPQRGFSSFSFRKLRFVTSHPEYVNVLPNPFWGSFLSHLQSRFPCVMMSVSSQNTRFRRMSSAERMEAAACLLRFSYVSVRDGWTQKMMSWISKGSCAPEITPDPVFAFSQNVPAALSDRSVIQRFQLPDKYILLSFKKDHCVPSAWVDRFAALARSNGYECVALTYPQEMNAFALHRRVEIPLNPLEWYSLIKHSSGYVGHNMHPIVSCIHNNVPFYSFDNYGYLYLRLFSNKKSSKIHTLLEDLGLLDYTSNVTGRFTSFAPPETVWQKLASFDRHKCAAAAALMSSRYLAMMQKIESALAAGRFVKSL